MLIVFTAAAAAAAARLNISEGIKQKTQSHPDQPPRAYSGLNH
jgi:hypothetical protein